MLSADVCLCRFVHKGRCLYVIRGVSLFPFGGFVGVGEEGLFCKFWQKRCVGQTNLDLQEL